MDILGRSCMFISSLVKLLLSLKALCGLFSIFPNFNERCKKKENEDYKN